MSRAASIAGFEDPLGDDNDCGICLEADLDVAINGCKHRLCIDCSIRSGCLEASCLILGAVLLHAWHAVFAPENDSDALDRMPLMGNTIRMHTYASVLRVFAALHALHTSVCRWATVIVSLQAVRGDKETAAVPLLPQLH